MKLVVDTNIIFAALIKDSISRHIITHCSDELITINFSDKEIAKYRAYLEKKAEVSSAEFDAILGKLKEHLVFISDDVVSEYMGEASIIMDGIYHNDTPFIAAALATQADIWSDDMHFQKQKRVKVWKTEELTKVIQFF